jgi:Tfp pilus assembly protein PilN
MEGAVNLDIEVPKLSRQEIKKALGFELQRQVPVPVENLVWTYRVTGHSANKTKVRIFAVKEEIWNKFLDALIQSGIKCDALLHPIFCEGLSSEGELDAINEFYEELWHVSSEAAPNSSVIERIKSLLKGDAAESAKAGSSAGFFMSLVLASYATGNTFRTDRALYLPLPKQLLLARFKFLKNAFAALSSLTFFLLFLLCFRHVFDARERFAEITSEQRRVESEILRLNQEEMREKEIDDFMKKLKDSDPGDAEIIAALLSLTKNLPPHMWISMFSSRGDEIDLTVSTRRDKDAQAELSKLNQLGEFSNVSTKNTRRDSDGTLTIYLKMTHKKDIR